MCLCVCVGVVVCVALWFYNGNTFFFFSQVRGGCFLGFFFFFFFCHSHLLSNPPEEVRGKAEAGNGCATWEIIQTLRSERDTQEASLPPAAVLPAGGRARGTAMLRRKNTTCLIPKLKKKTLFTNNVCLSSQ